MDFGKYLKEGIKINPAFQFIIKNEIETHPMISDQITRHIIFDTTMLEYIKQLHDNKTEQEAENIAKSILQTLLFQEQANILKKLRGLD